MAITKASAQTTVNSGVTAAAAATVNQITTAPSTATVVAGGGSLGGVTISNVAITDSTFANVLSGDTAVSSAGGFVRITGTGFKTGANVFLGSTVLANTFINSTQINANIPASSNGSYQFTVFNTDGSGAISPAGLLISGPPSWTSTSYSSGSLTLGIQLLASGDAPLTYYIQPGSANPQNLAVNSTGFLSGTVSSDGAYTITVVVDDAQGQSTQADITVTVSLADPYFNLTTLLLSANGTNEANNHVFSDSSTNNFSITRNGNTTQGTFSPYGDNWSNYFDGTGDSLSISSPTPQLSFGTGDFTIELWVYKISADNDGLLDARSSASATPWFLGIDGSNFPYFYDGTSYTSSISINLNSWNHVSVVRSSGVLRIFVNGAQGYSASYGVNLDRTAGLVIGDTVHAVAPLSGYISNLRIVKGSAVYTSTFTPPTTPLTAITNTSLLTCQSNRFIDNSSNAFAITRNGDVSVQRFSPFAPSAEYSVAAVGGSGYFDGSGDYLTAAANAAFQFGTGNFTIEYWYYPTVLGTNTPIDMGYANTGSYVIQNASDGKPYFYSGTTGIVFTATTGYLLNAWNHLAVTRSGTTLSMFINGVRVGTATNSTNFNANFSLGIGGSPTHSIIYEVTGYLSSVRLLKGTAVYDPTLTTLTVPTAPLTAITNTSLLCNFTNAGIVDGTMKNNLETVGNAQLSTSVKKFGSSSIAFDGSGDYLSTPSLVINNLNGDFTVEGWIYRNGSGVLHPIFNLGDYQGSSGILFYVTSGNALAIYTNNGLAMSGGTVSATTWTHVALVRSGSGSGNIKLYVNGTSVGTPATNNTTFTGRLLIGADLYGGAITNFMNGYIDDLRITKGFARYTANFTPPTATFNLR